MLEAARLSNEDIHIALQHDSEFFINFFMGAEMVVPTPDFHKEIFDLMVHKDVPQLCLAIPRAHAKTTLVKLAAVYYFMFSDFTYILYMSSVVGHSIECVNDIADFLQSDNFVSVYGHCEWFTKQEGKGYYKFRMPNKGKVCILKAFGAEQKVRGTNIKHKRPELIIVDDLEDNDNLASKETFEKLKRWMYGPFKKAVNPLKNKFLWIGNMIARQSMLYEHCQSQFWFSRVYGCLLQDGKPLWPDLWSLDRLRADFQEYSDRGMADIWFAEMMNMPLAGLNGIIKADEIVYKPPMMPGDSTIGFITVDLAISKNTWADDTSLNVHLWNQDLELWQVVDTVTRKGMGPIEVFRECIRLGQKWYIGVVAIESVAWQAAASEVFEHLAMMEYIQGFTFLNVPSRASKTERIVTWADMIKQGLYALTLGDFIITHELLMYDPQKKDNVDNTIDSCALAPKVLAMYTTEIWASKYIQDNPNAFAVQNSYQISRI